MRIRVDPELCSGHARCGDVAPEIYELDDEGYNLLRHEGVVEVPPGQEAAAERGMRVCPERAILVVEEATAEAATGRSTDS
jgi:ferredoxin